MSQMISDALMNKCVDDSVYMLSNSSNSHVYYYNYAHKNNVPWNLNSRWFRNFDQGTKTSSVYCYGFHKVSCYCYF